MRTIWDEEALADLEKLFENNDRKLIKKLFKLIHDIERNGVDQGIGKPEHLKYELASYWSREISSEDRLVYYIGENDTLHIVSCKTHYHK